MGIFSSIKEKVTEYKNKVASTFDATKSKIAIAGLTIAENYNKGLAIFENTFDFSKPQALSLDDYLEKQGMLELTPLQKRMRDIEKRWERKYPYGLGKTYRNLTSISKEIANNYAFLKNESATATHTAKANMYESMKNKYDDMMINFNYISGLQNEEN